MKRFLAILLIITTVFVLAACGTEIQPGSEYAGPINLTDDFTFQDPEDISWVYRYVYVMDSTSDTAKNYNEYWNSNFKVDLTFDKVYYVLYSDKNDQPLRAYDFYVFKTQEEVEKYQIIANYMGIGTINVKDTVCYSVAPRDEMEANFDLYIYYGYMSDKKKDRNCANFMKALSEQSDLREYKGK